MDQIQQLMATAVSALANQHVLTVVVLLAVGFFLRSIPKFPNDWIPSSIAGAGIIAGIVYLAPMPYSVRIGHGLTYAAFSCFLYELGVKRFQDWLAAKLSNFFGRGANAPTDVTSNPQPTQEKK